MKIQTEPYRKIAARTAADVCQKVELSPEGRAYLLPTLSPQGFLSLLVESEQIGDAIRFLAFCLPNREAIWWACVTAHGFLTTPTPIESTCLERAAGWVYEPSEQRRRSCMAASEQAQFSGAAAYAALAVFWSGGSLAPEGLPDAPADPRLCSIGVGASVLLAITAGDPKQLPLRFEIAMRRGTDVANGGNGWMNGDRPLNAANEKLS